MPSHSLELLTEADLELLRASARRERLEADTVVLEDDGPVADVFFIRRGFVRVEKDELVVARLGPGEVFGEMSFLNDVPASASVVAEGDVEIDRLPTARLRSVLTANPEIAARFYGSLAVSLSHRLRATSAMLARARREAGDEMAGARAVRVGEITERQVPEPVREDLASFRASIERAEETARAPGHDEAVVAQVAAALDTMLVALGDHTGGEAILEMGYADPLAFRDQDHLRSGVGTLWFRDAFPTLMMSNTMARLYSRPRSVIEDHETVRAIIDDEAIGDGAIGRAVDRWFLDRPVCRARRAARVAVADRLATLFEHGSGPMRVCDLACGAAPALLGALAGRADIECLLTLIDSDAEALREVGAEAEALGLRHDLLPICADVVDLQDPATEVALEPHDAILAVDLIEYLDDDAVTGLLEWCWEHLAPGGTALMTTIDAGHADGALMTTFLEWHVRARSESDLRALVSSSPFGAPSMFEPLDGGPGVVLTLERRA